MASMRDIKRRKESVTSTGQITKAMKLVSTVKLQHAKSHVEEAKPYFQHLYDAINSILSKSEGVSHPLLSGGDSKKKAIILVTSNRGLAGGYNSNAIKLITKGGFEKDDVVVYAVGRKGKEALVNLGYDVRKDYSEVMNKPLFSDAVEIGREVMQAFKDNEVGEIYLAYTIFKNTVVHIPTIKRLLPFVPEEGDVREKKTIEDLTLMNYEPESEEVLSEIIPKYVNGIIYGALIEALASENGARMQAMDNATNNAEEMIADLELKYNRARQGSITQELTEIVAGASAIN
ncbi:MAG: ATP synthase F1 subunit gamma [Lachnospiraceae bacterium]|nr:ATP synthase F1 subunit gamma [Lachnospiraceae bacterium]